MACEEAGAGDGLSAAATGSCMAVVRGPSSPAEQGGRLEPLHAWRGELQHCTVATGDRPMHLGPVRRASAALTLLLLQPTDPGARACTPLPRCDCHTLTSAHAPRCMPRRRCPAAERRQPLVLW
eukprot:334888-Chlamydomonas_euryale.AAC.5